MGRCVLLHLKRSLPPAGNRRLFCATHRSVDDWAASPPLRLSFPSEAGLLRDAMMVRFGGSHPNVQAKTRRPLQALGLTRERCVAKKHLKLVLYQRIFKQPISFLPTLLSVMRIGIDGIPLATPKSGIGHYTFELARSMAILVPSAKWELVAPVPIDLCAQQDQGESPANLAAVHLPLNPFRRRWWTIGLSLYARRHKLALFHGTNYNVPLWNPCPTVVTIHDLSLFLHPGTHPENLVQRARRRLPVMTRIATRIITGCTQGKVNCYSFYRSFFR